MNSHTRCEATVCGLLNTEIKKKKRSYESGTDSSCQIIKKMSNISETLQQGAHACGYHKLEFIFDTKFNNISLNLRYTFIWSSPGIFRNK